MSRSPDLTRVLLLTGKGGVGKTSVAAATAVLAAARGKRVLVTSTDPAHSLADALDTPLGDRVASITLPTGVTRATGLTGGCLDGLQLDTQQRLERHWREIREYLTAVLSWGGVGDVAAEELVVLPGLDELFALIDLHARVESGTYDLVVVDCAPTAETLKLLALPDALRWYSERVLTPGRRLARALRPLARSLVPGSVLPVPGEHVFDALEELHVKLVAVHRLLTDPARASVRLVTNPERLVLAETRRTATTLSLFGYPVDAVVLNRLLPDQVDDPYLARWKDRHAAHLAAARDAFAPTPVLTAPLMDDEIDGIDGLAALGELLYGTLDPAAVLHEGRPVTIDDTDEPTVLRVALPFVGSEELELHHAGDELYLKVSGVNRSVPLPSALQRREVTGASFEGSHLEVRFAAAGAAAAGAVRP